jgi:hypothetical protein
MSVIINERYIRILGWVKEKTQISDEAKEKYKKEILRILSCPSFFLVTIFPNPTKIGMLLS